jgi:hypothetical protein
MTLRAVADPGRWLTPGRSLLVAVALYLVVTVHGVLTDSFHSDDWRHLTGASPLWTRVEGRWLLDAIYRYLLGERFLLPIQLTLAFPCLCWVAWELAGRAAAPAERGLAALLVFALGVNHPFMSDILTFGANVFAYPFALALSVAAFVTIERSEGAPVARQAAHAALAAVLLSFSVSIYQTFAVAGLIVPALALIRADRVTFRAALRLALISVLASVAAIALYLVEWRIYADLQGVTIGGDRFQAASAAGMSQKAAALPGLIRNLQTGTLMQLPYGLRVILGCLSLAAVGLGIISALRMLSGALAGGRILGPLRVGMGLALALFVFPVIFWLGYEGDNAPARAFGYFGFWVAALFLASATMAFPAPLPRRIAHAALTLGALVIAVTASAFWSDTARAGQRDVERARAIYARLASLPGYQGGTFRLVGGRSDSDLSWGTLASWSSFHGGNPSIGIFRELFGQTDYVASLPASPRACRGFPAADSTFLHDGIAYICLEDFAPFTDALSCAPLNGAADEALCLGPKIMVHLGADCLATGAGKPDLSVAFRENGRAYAPERYFSVASFPVRIGARCATMALAPNTRDLAALEVTFWSPDGKVDRRQDIQARDLGPATSAP